METCFRIEIRPALPESRISCFRQIGVHAVGWELNHDLVLQQKISIDVKE